LRVAVRSASMLFNVKPADPLTYAAISMVLCVAALLASYIPAMRATHSDPVEALQVD
jgi:ABC-type lipoprotein release transport system permease subunit